MTLRSEAAPQVRPEPPATGNGWIDEIRSTFRLAWPLIVAQLAQISLLTTDIVMMGWLGPEFLAAGTLANGFFHPLFLGGMGVLTATAPLIAQAIGARQGKSVRRTVRQGFWVSGVMALLLTTAILQGERLFGALGQAPATSALAGTYLVFVAWMVLPALLFTTLRALLSARGDTTVILWITLAGFAVNFVANYALMFGNFGLPRLELAGAGLATTIVETIMFALALWFVTVHRRYRRYHILVRFFRPDWHRFREIFRIGVPIGLMLVAEVGIFGAAAMMMGLLGTNELAAHAIAMQCAGITFMVPLGLSQATTIRVGLAQGALRPDGVSRAGWTSLVMGAGFMSMTCLLFLFVPGPLVTLFLDPGEPANAAALGLAATYLAIAGLFQLFDGAQVVSAAALRGLSDTRVPMIVAIVGYWLVGMPAAWLFGFVLDWRGVGIWVGLAIGLAFVAVVLTVRWGWRERLGLVRSAAFVPLAAGRAAGT